jgi:hypothetical protein
LGLAAGAVAAGGDECAVGVEDIGVWGEIIRAAYGMVSGKFAYFFRFFLLLFFSIFY